MSLMLSLALLAAQDAPLPLLPTDKRYSAAAATVRSWIVAADTKAKGEPLQLFICDWRPGHRLAFVKIIHEGNMGDYPSQAFLIERDGKPVRAAWRDGKAIGSSDQPIVDTGLKLCAAQLAQ